MMIIHFLFGPNSCMFLWHAGDIIVVGSLGTSVEKDSCGLLFEEMFALSDGPSSLDVLDVT